MSDLIRRNLSPEYSGIQPKILISPEAEKMLREHPEYCTSKDIQDLINRLTSPERSGVAQVEVQMNDKQNLEIIIRSLYSQADNNVVLRRDVRFERTAQGWVYERKVFFNEQGDELKDNSKGITKRLPQS